MMAEADDDRTSRRVARLGVELDDEHVPLLDRARVPELDRLRASYRDVVLDEVTYARHVPVHEGRRPPYGSLVVADLHGLPAELVVRAPTVKEAISEIRA